MFKLKALGQAATFAEVFKLLQIIKKLIIQNFFTILHRVSYMSTLTLKMTLGFCWIGCLHFWISKNRFYLHIYLMKWKKVNPANSLGDMIAFVKIKIFLVLRFENPQIYVLLEIDYGINRILNFSNWNPDY